jgi:hypothetical protein
VLFQHVQKDQIVIFTCYCTDAICVYLSLSEALDSPFFTHSDVANSTYENTPTSQEGILST